MAVGLGRGDTLVRKVALKFYSFSTQGHCSFPKQPLCPLGCRVSLLASRVLRGRGRSKMVPRSQWKVFLP